MRSESQIKAQILAEMQPTGSLTAIQMMPWVVKVLHFLLLEKIAGR